MTNTDPSQPEVVSSLNCHDVLCGRGSGPNDFIGNIRFRDVVAARRDDYLATSSRVEKAEIAEEIFKSIQSFDPPGRFLEKANDGGKMNHSWSVVSKEKSLEKVKQALRQNQKQKDPRSPGKSSPKSLSSNNSKASKCISSAIQALDLDASVKSSGSTKNHENSASLTSLDNTMVIENISVLPASKKDLSTVKTDFESLASCVFSKTLLRNDKSASEVVSGAGMIFRETTFPPLDVPEIYCDQSLDLPTESIGDIPEPSLMKDFNKVDEDEIYNMSVSMSSLLSQFDSVENGNGHFAPDALTLSSSFTSKLRPHVIDIASKPPNSRIQTVSRSSFESNESSRRSSSSRSRSSIISRLSIPLSVLDEELDHDGIKLDYSMVSQLLKYDEESCDDISLRPFEEIQQGMDDLGKMSDSAKSLLHMMAKGDTD